MSARLVFDNIYRRCQVEPETLLAVGDHWPGLTGIRLTHARCSRVYKSSRRFEIFPFDPGSLLALEVHD
jgi:hypothetical protein